MIIEARTTQGYVLLSFYFPNASFPEMTAWDSIQGPLDATTGQMVAKDIRTFDDSTVEKVSSYELVEYTMINLLVFIDKSKFKRHRLSPIKVT